MASQTPSSSPFQLLRRRDVYKLLSVSRSTLQRLIQEDGFPAGVRLRGNTVVWRAAEIHAWIAARWKDESIQAKGGRQ